MLNPAAKKAFYTLAGPIMGVNAFFYKHFRLRKSERLIKLHLGPGQNKYIKGWVNIDANMFTGKCDLWADLRHPLPFYDSTVDAVYSHHMVEHLPNLSAHFKDVHRCLKPGASYRVGGPNGDSAIRKFVDGEKEWFGDWPDSRRSIGGRFENFIFCRGEHLTILTYSFLEELLSDAGFINVRPCLPTKETHYPAVFQECLAVEHETDFGSPRTLIVEAQKA